MGRILELTAADALAARWHALRLSPAAAAPHDLAGAVHDLVTWFGAMQGQDPRSLSWSLGVRLPGATAADLVAAAEAAGVVRTWPMRGTLHLVPGRDVRWMLDLMAGRTARADLTRWGQLGLTVAHADRAVEVLAEALAGGRRLTREECLGRFADAGLPVAGQAGYHLLAQACRRGTACLAPEVDGRPTFVLLDDWAPDQRSLDPDEALAEIALRFVRSHGPVRRHDLAGWTGLRLRDVDRGLAAHGDLVPVTVEGVPMVAWAPALAGPPAGHRLLPGFDEYLLGYKDRTLHLDQAHRQVIVPGGNGVFAPTMVRDGRVVGTWRREAARRGAGRGPAGPRRADVVSCRPLTTLSARDRSAFEAAAAGFGRFLDRPVEVRWEA